MITLLFPFLPNTILIFSMFSSTWRLNIFASYISGLLLQEDKPNLLQAESGELATLGQTAGDTSMGEVHTVSFIPLESFLLPQTMAKNRNKLKYIRRHNDFCGELKVGKTMGERQKRSTTNKYEE